MMHELEVALPGALGSIDANTGDYLLGWDTDQFPTNIYLTTQCMLCILRHGRLHHRRRQLRRQGRRESFEPIDLFHAHIGGMDAFARGLKIAHGNRPTAGSPHSSRNATRAGTASWAVGSKPVKASFSDLEAYILPKGDAAKNSGRQEMLENLINEFI